MSETKENLLAVLNKLKERILEAEKSSLVLSEQDTRQGLINPLFGALGWDFSDFTAVKGEYRHRSHNDPADYALFGSKDREKPVLLVEAKSLDTDLSSNKIVKQLCSYLGEIGVQWGVLTDGNRYTMYNSKAGNSFEDQKFLTMQIKTADTEDGVTSTELADKLEALLSRKCLESDRIQKFYEDHIINRQVEDALWSLLAEPFDTLAAAIRKEFKQERVDTDPQLRISTKQIIAYLETLKDEEGRIPLYLEDNSATTDDNAIHSVVSAQGEGTDDVESIAKTKRITVSDLLQDEHKGEFFWGRITGNGEIDVNGTVCSTPSKAAQMVIGKSANGWGLWRYKKDKQGEWLKANLLRSQYRAKHK